MNDENLKVGLAKYIPFTTARKVYKQQLKAELFRLATKDMSKKEVDIYKTRQTEMTWINGTSWMLITLITGLWGAYYNIDLFQEKMPWLALGMHQTDPSWIEHAALFVVPAGSGTVLHNLPKLLPGQKLKIAGHLTIKIVPVLLLTVFYILIHYEKQIHKIKKNVYNESAE